MLSDIILKSSEQKEGGGCNYTVEKPGKQEQRSNWDIAAESICSAEVGVELTSDK